MKTLPSKRFGGWEMRCNGLQQHALGNHGPVKAKAFLRSLRNGDLGVKLPKKQAKRVLNEKLNTECWYSLDGKYKVTKQVLLKGNHYLIQSDLEGTIHLSVRIDMGKTYLRDWRDFQTIKNELVGEEYQAIEIYPQESRLNDMVNVFHLWVFPEEYWMGLGWGERDVGDEDDDEVLKGQQRKLDRYTEDIKKPFVKINENAKKFY
jgi:hypothetical protein